MSNPDTMTGPDGSVFFTGFGPETIDWEAHDGAGRVLLESTTVESNVPAVPVGQLAPSVTSPAGEPPNYIAPQDKARKSALEPRAPGVGDGQPIPTGERIVMHHVYETIERGAETAIIHAVPSIGSTPVQIVGKSEQRSKATIQNNGTVTVSLGMDEALSATGFNRFDLSAGSSLDIHHRDQMWAVCASGTGQLQIIVTISEISPTQLGVLRDTRKS